MKFTAFMSGLFALAKALPIIDKWLDKITEAWFDKKIIESDQARETYRNEKKALNKAIERAENDEEIKYLSITLRRLNRGELPNAKNPS